MGREESESEEGTEEAKARGLNLGQEEDRGAEPREEGLRAGPRMAPHRPSVSHQWIETPAGTLPTSLQNNKSSHWSAQKRCIWATHSQKRDATLHRVPWTPEGANALPSGWCLRKSQGLRRPSIRAGTEGVNASWPVYDLEPEAS